MSKATTLAAVTEAAGAKAAATLAGLKKEGAAAGAEQLLAESGWLPRCLRTQSLAGRGRGIQEVQEVAASGGDDGGEYEQVDAHQVD